MAIRMMWAIVGLAALNPPLRADTLTLRSNIEINGQVQYANDAFTVTAKYNNGKKIFTFGRKEVQSLEINSRDFNPGEPPISVSTFDPRVANARDASLEAPTTDKNRDSTKEKTGEKKQSGSSQSSVLGADTVLAANDLVWLKDKSKIVGRVTLIEKGAITIQIGNANKQIDEQKVVTVLVAQD